MCAQFGPREYPPSLLLQGVSAGSPGGGAGGPAAPGQAAAGRSRPGTEGIIKLSSQLVVGKEKRKITWRNIGFMRCSCSSQLLSRAPRWGSGVMAALLGRQDSPGPRSTAARSCTGHL